MLYYIKNVIMYVFNNKEYLLSLKKKIVSKFLRAFFSNTKFAKKIDKKKWSYFLPHEILYRNLIINILSHQADFLQLTGNNFETFLPLIQAFMGQVHFFGLQKGEAQKEYSVHRHLLPTPE